MCMCLVVKQINSWDFETSASMRQIPSNIWQCFSFWKIWPWPMTLSFGKFKVIVTWVIECALLCCTLVPNIKSVGEIASEIWFISWCLTRFWTFDLDLWLWQGYCYMDNWMLLIGLYLTTMYEVCVLNRLLYCINTGSISAWTLKFVPLTLGH